MGLSRGTLFSAAAIIALIMCLLCAQACAGAYMPDGSILSSNGRSSCDSLGSRAGAEDTAFVAVTINNVDSLLTCGKPLLLEFWAPWCGPCRTIAASLDDLASCYSTRMAFGKCNVDENSSLVKEYKVRFIPVVVIISNGVVVARKTGLTSRKALENEILKALSASGVGVE